MKNKEFFDILHSRRSIKQFTDDKIPYEDLLEIAKAARATPTSVNLQSRKFTMVQNKSLIQELETALGQAIGQPGYDLYNANALLLISSRRGYTYNEIETGLAVQNPYLAATALGYGTTWTDQIRHLSDEKYFRAVLNKLEIPSNHILWTILPIGVPADDLPVKNQTKETNIIE